MHYKSCLENGMAYLLSLKLIKIETVTITFINHIHSM